MASMLLLLVAEGVEFASSIRVLCIPIVAVRLVCGLDSEDRSLAATSRSSSAAAQ